MKPVTKEQMFSLAKAALEHLEYHDDAETWRVGSHGRPFGNSFPDNIYGILAKADVIDFRIDHSVTPEEIEYAEEIWKNLGDFIQSECKLVLK